MPASEVHAPPRATTQGLLIKRRLDLSPEFEVNLELD